MAAVVPAPATADGHVRVRSTCGGRIPGRGRDALQVLLLFSGGAFGYGKICLEFQKVVNLFIKDVELFNLYNL